MKSADDIDPTVDDGLRGGRVAESRYFVSSIHGRASTCMPCPRATTRLGYDPTRSKGTIAYDYVPASDFALVRTIDAQLRIVQHAPVTPSHAPREGSPTSGGRTLSCRCGTRAGGI